MTAFRETQRICRVAALLLLFLVYSAAAAAQAVVAKNAWARATAPGQATAAVYLEIVSSRDAALVGAATPLAKAAEIHATRTAGGVMKMRPVARVDLPAGKTVRLAPGGLHIMLVGLKQPLRENDRVPVELTVESTGGSSAIVTIEAEVRPIGAGAHHAH